MKQRVQIVTTSRLSDWHYVDGGQAGLPGWRVGFRTGMHASSAVVIASLQRTPIDENAPVPDNGITGRLLKKLRLGGDKAAREIRRVEKALRHLTMSREEELKLFRRRRWPGRPRVRSLSWYKDFAARYRELAVGEKRVLEREFKLTPAAMRSVVWRCRHTYKLLGKTTPGTAKTGQP